MNIAAAAVLALSIAFYVFVYTVWLKRRTPQNIVIGGAAGAFPAVVGWAAVTGSVDLVPLMLFAIVFFWTPPHFWSLALFANDDYRRAGVPMLPVVAGAKETRRQIVIYTLLLMPLSLVPWWIGFSGPIYGIAALVLDAGFLVCVLRVLRRPAGCGGRQPDRRCAGAGIVPLLDRCICSCCSPRSRWTGWSGDAGAAWNRIRRVPRRAGRGDAPPPPRPQHRIDRRAGGTGGAVLRHHHRQAAPARAVLMMISAPSFRARWPLN